MPTQDQVAYQARYYQDNKDKINKRMRQYRLDNKVKIREHEVQYLLENKEKRDAHQKAKIQCACGVIHTRAGTIAHLYTKKHTRRLLAAQQSN